MAIVCRIVGYSQVPGRVRRGAHEDEGTTDVSIKAPHSGKVAHTEGFGEAIAPPTVKKAQRLAARPARAAPAQVPARPVLRDVRRSQPVADHILRQEVLLHKAADARTNAVLAARDDRGMRDAQPEGMTKECGHREPIGNRCQGAVHTRLRGAPMFTQLPQRTATTLAPVRSAGTL